MTIPEPAAESPPPGPARKSGRSRLWWALAALPFVPWAIGLAARWWWFAELFTHFRFQWLLGTGAVGLVLLFARQWIPLALCGVAAWVLAAPLLDGVIYRGGEGKLRGPDPPLTVVTANVLTRNRDAASLLAYLEAADPDVLCLQEIDSSWAAALAPLHDEYPHRLVVPDDLGNFGMAVYSRFPAVFREETIEGVPRIRAEVDVNGRSLTVFNVHTSPPMGAVRAGERNRGMARLAADAAATAGPVVVCGDLNCSPWSPYFADLLKDGGLADPRAGGRNPTSWRAENPLFALPIDHLLGGGEARVLFLTAGPDIGSDHRPLQAQVFP